MNKFFILLAILFATTASAQVNMDQFKHMDMRHIGPGTMSGRVTSIDVVRDRPEIIYIGTASGGLWKSESGGITWESMSEEMPVQSIGAIAIDPSNPDVIWAGTGEGNPRNSHTSGAGIFKSLDGGKHWTLMGLEKTKTIHRIIVHRDNPDVVWVATLGSAWGPNKERGVYKTTDGGNSWTQVLYINDSTGCADLIVDPVNPNKLYAGMWEYGRKPWTFNSGGGASGLYISFDGGDSWQERTDKDGLPEGPLGRIGLANSAANPDVVYALVEAKTTGLYKSEDGGFNWELVSTKNIGNRPFYYADIYAHPKDENTLFNLYSLVSKSIDGGKTFDVILPYSGVHPDHHALYIHPDHPEFMINGNDGGLNISRDGGENWEFITNLPLGQFYHINYDNEVPYNVYGGMQDNGSWQGPSYVWHSGGIRNEDWQEIGFGDGFDVVSDPSNSEYAYCMYQGGNVSRVHIPTGKSWFIQPNHPDGDILRFNWNAAISEDPFNKEGLYFGSQYVHHSTDHGESWRIISPDLTTNDSTKQKQAESGGLTIDATRAENYTSILCISPSPSDQAVIWVGTDDGKVQLTRNAGESWTDLSGTIKGMPKGAWIAQIQVNATNPGEAFVVANDYRRNNWEPYLFYTPNYGKTWTNLVDSDEVSGHCLSMVQDPVVPDLLFLGTENGLYISFDKGANWNHWNHNYPTVSTMDLKIHPREHDLIIGTFGRGCYILDDIRPLRAIATNGKLKDVQVFESTGYLHDWRRARGIRFAADHNWSGSNRRGGLAFSYYVHPDSVSDPEEKKKATFRIIDQMGDTLRTLTAVPDSGMNRMSWWMDEKGTHFPSRKEPKKDREPGGADVMPGQYWMHVEYKGMKDSTMVTVTPDPNVDFDMDAAKQRRAFYNGFMADVERASEGMKRVREAREAVKLVQNRLSLVEDSTLSDLKAKTDSITQSLNELEGLYMLPADFEGYDHVTVLLEDRIWQAYSFFGPNDRMPAGNAQNAVNAARSEIDKVLAEIDTFFELEWKKWREDVEQFDLNPFRKIDQD